MFSLKVLELQLVDAWIQENVCSLDGVYSNSIIRFNAEPKADAERVYTVGNIAISVSYDEYGCPQFIYVVGLTEWQREMYKKLF